MVPGADETQLSWRSALACAEYAKNHKEKKKFLRQIKFSRVYLDKIKFAKRAGSMNSNNHETRRHFKERQGAIENNLIGYSLVHQVVHWLQPD